MPYVDYKGLTTNKDKLFAVYSLVGEIARYKLSLDQQFLDKQFHPDKWRAFCKQYNQITTPLYAEQNRLKQAIIDSQYTVKQWERLSADQQSDFQDLYHGQRQYIAQEPTLAKTTLLDKLKSLDINNLQGLQLPLDPLEDWTSGYTEVDTAAKLTVAANTLTAAAVSSTDMYHYKDFTAGHFDAIDVLCTLQWVNQTGQYPGIGIGFTVSAVNDHTGWGSTDISFQCRCNAGTYYRWRLIIGNGTTGDYYEIQSYITRYIRLQRAAGNTAVSCILYPTAADRTNDTNRTDTLAATGVGTATYRYCYGAVNKAEAGNNSVTISDMDLQEAAPAAGACPQIAYLMNRAYRRR